MIASRFKMHLRCLNCRRNSVHMLDVPEADDAPCDVEELMESAFLQSWKYACLACESSIGTIVCVNRVELEGAT